MAFIGAKPTNVPLTANDITDGSISVAKLTSTLDLSSNTVTLPSGVGGKVLQVSSIVQGATNQNIATTSYTDLTNMSINITPSATSSKILIVFAVFGRLQDAEGFGVRLERGSTSIYSNPTYSILADANPLNELYTGATFNYIDSPNSTSQQTYKLGVATHDNNEVNFNASAKSYMYLMEIGA